jgi:hypothetical protein
MVSLLTIASLALGIAVLLFGFFLRLQTISLSADMAMQDQVDATTTPKRAPWNKGTLTSGKPPLRPKHVWSIRTKLQIEGRARDLAMFNLAIDSKLRGCDVVAKRIEDGAGGGIHGGSRNGSSRENRAYCQI